MKAMKQELENFLNYQKELYDTKKALLEHHTKAIEILEIRIEDSEQLIYELEEIIKRCEETHIVSSGPC